MDVQSNAHRSSNGPKLGPTSNSMCQNPEIFITDALDLLNSTSQSSLNAHDISNPTISEVDPTENAQIFLYFTLLCYVLSICLYICMHTPFSTIHDKSKLDPTAETFVPRGVGDHFDHDNFVVGNTILNTTPDSFSSSISSSISDDFTQDNVIDVLREIRIKNINRLIIGTLNINSLAPKFEQLKVIIGNYLDVLVIVETKLDPSFPTEQFLIDGYGKPYRLDRNREGGGIIIYIREDIPSKELNNHNFTKNVEGLFIEVNLRKTKFLLFGTYHSKNIEYGLSDDEYFNQIGLALDIYSNYDTFLLTGDFNIEEGERCLKDFLYEFKARNLVKQKTCFKSINNPRCIDLFLTNCYQKFLNTTAVSTGLSDFHKMVVTVMKTTFPKAKPKIIQYRDNKNFVEEDFRFELRTRLRNETVNNYSKFEEVFLEVLNKHAPPKKKVLRANHKPL